MSKLCNAALVGALVFAASAITTPAMAATAPAKAPAAKAVAATKAAPVVKVHTAAPPAAHVTAVKPAAPTSRPGMFSFTKPAAARPAPRPAANGRMVQARLSNGKTVTYNCSLAGNQTKQACKR